MTPRKMRQEIEGLLSKFCDISAISNLLSPQERSRLFRISVEFSKEAIKVENAGLKVLGIEVAQGVARDYLLCLLTANAVKLLNKNGTHPVILEMGMGSGLNAVAALTVDPRAKYLGVELNDVCIRFASRQFVLRGMEKNVEIIKGDYEHVKIRKKADIIINENLGPHLVEEPQMLAAKSALKFSKKNALFIPSGVFLYGLYNGKRKEIRKIDFRSVPPNRVSFSVRLSQRTTFRPGFDILDFQGDRISQKNPKQFIPHLPLVGEPMKLKGKKPVRITLDFSGRKIIVEDSLLQKKRKI